MESSGQRNFRYLIYSVLIALLFLLVKGYKFNTGDQAEHLPQVYQLIDPGLYQDDFFVTAAKESITIRTVYVYLVYFLSFLAPLPLLCFLLTVACLAITCYGIMRITGLASSDPLSVYLSPLLVFFLFYGGTVGGNHLQSNMLICTSFSEAFAIFGIYFFLREKHYLSSLLLGVATLFQLLVGLQLFLILTCILLIHLKRYRSRIPAFILIYIASGAFILFPIFYRQFFLSAGNYDKALYYELLFSFRNYLHYIPSLFPASDYIKLLVTTAFAMPVLLRKSYPSFFKHFYVLAATGLVVYTLSLEVFGLFAAGKIQWFKTTVWIAAFNGIAVSVPLGRLGRSLNGIRTEKLIASLSGIGSIILLAVITNSSLIPFEKLRYRYHAGNYPKTDLARMHEWIGKNTDVKSVILTPPDDSGFLCEAKRSTPVAFKPIIHEPSFLLPWYERFREIYGVDIEKASGKKALDVATALYETRNYRTDKFHIRYRIDNRKTCKFTSELKKIVHREGDYILTEY
jgi:hypothetical protein